MFKKYYATLNLFRFKNFKMGIYINHHNYYLLYKHIHRDLGIGF